MTVAKRWSEFEGESTSFIVIMTCMLTLDGATVIVDFIVSSHPFNKENKTKRKREQKTNEKLHQQYTSDVVLLLDYQSIVLD